MRIFFSQGIIKLHWSLRESRVSRYRCL